MRLDATVLTDLSANVFAALLLVLLILLQAMGEEEATPAAPPRAVEATVALDGTWRAPLRAADLIAFLYDRRPGAPGLSLDLTAAPGPDLGARLGDADRGTPVRLYVFTNDSYGAAREALTRAGLRWQEVSVPRALRDPTGADWSAAFRELLARGLDLPRFRDGLARLLAAGPGPRTRDDGAARAGASGSAAGADGEPLLGRLARWLGLALAVGSVLAGFLAVAVVERVVPPARPRYPRAQAADGDAPAGGGQAR